MKKKKLALGVGLLVLLAGGVGIAQVAQGTKQEAVNSHKKAETKAYDAALQAIEAAEKSRSDQDIQQAQALIDKVSMNKFYLQDRLAKLQESIRQDGGWKGLDDLLQVAEANPLDDAAVQAARNKYDEIMADPRVVYDLVEETYYLRLHGLQYKKGDVLVSQAEASLSQADHQVAADFYNNHLQQYFKDYSREIKDAQTGEKVWSFSREHESLLARLNALAAHRQQLAAGQAQSGNGGQTYVGGDAGGYVGNQGGYTAQTPQLPQGETYKDPYKGTLYQQGRWTDQAAEEELNNPDNWVDMGDGTKRYIGDSGTGITTFSH